MRINRVFINNGCSKHFNEKGGVQTPEKKMLEGSNGNFQLKL
jgi:hypothetical protein